MIVGCLVRTARPRDLGYIRATSSETEGPKSFEMLTGRRAFVGKSQASLLGAILKEQPPPVSQVVLVTPPALDHVVGVCLAKDPDSRFQTAHDLLLQLKWIAEGGSGAGVAAPVVAHRRSRERLAWIAAATLGVAPLAMGTITMKHLREAAPAIDPIQFTIAAPENSPFGYTTPQFALSPDGRQAVFAASLRGALVLWVRPLSTPAAKPLPGPEGATHPFWSPDSRSIGFFAAGRLKTVRVSGGAPVTSLAKGDRSHRWPTFLPDGRHFLFFVGVGDGSTGEIRAGSLDSKEPVAVVASDSNGLYAAGHVLFVRSGHLMAMPSDLDTRQSTADSFLVVGRRTSTGRRWTAVARSSGCRSQPLRTT
jgi:hypothetical protein